MARVKGEEEVLECPRGVGGVALGRGTPSRRRERSAAADLEGRSWGGVGKRGSLTSSPQPPDPYPAKIRSSGTTA